MLDTDMVGHLVKAHPAVIARVRALPMTALCVSAIAEGELRYGLAKRPDATRLFRLVAEVLRHLDILPWDSAAAARYGALRATMERLGRSLGPLDLLIAAHGLSADAVLATNDRAFGMVPDLIVEDWTCPPRHFFS
ncbi:MAG: type II toxin-antitoxin system VapC family toxin [Rhodospirillales bacterium]